MISQGMSMAPFINDGNVCRFAYVHAEALRRGDVALFQPAEGGLVGHRLMAIDCGEGGPWYIFKGDTNRLPDLPVTAERIIGRLETVHKRKLSLRASGFVAMLWGRLVLRVPLASIGLSRWTRRKSRTGSCG